MIVLEAKLGEKTEVGRPKLRWLDEVQTDLKITGIQG
jgi:hypothetical protein